METALSLVWNQQCIKSFSSSPGFEDDRMGHDDLPLAVEADVSIVSVDPKLSQLSHHQVVPVHAHVMCISRVWIWNAVFYPMLSKHKLSRKTLRIAIGDGCELNTSDINMEPFNHKGSGTLIGRIYGLCLKIRILLTRQVLGANLGRTVGNLKPR